MSCFQILVLKVLLFWFTMEEIMGICDSDDKKVIDVIKLEPCCNNHVSMKPEANNYTSNTGEHLRLQDGSDHQTNIKTDNIKQSWDQPQHTIDEVQIKHGMDRDSEIEVDLSFRIIDTYNICEVHPYNIDDENILSDTKTAFNIGQTDNKQAQLKVEVDNKTDLICEMTNTLNVCNIEKNTCIKENVDYENLNVDDDVNKKSVQHLQNKGM